MTVRRAFGFIGVIAIILGLFGLLSVATVPLAGQAGAALKTAWGEPDLQGIWENVYNVPLQRPTQYGTKEYLTDEERAVLDGRRAQTQGRDARVAQVGTERDVAGAYNAVFTSR